MASVLKVDKLDPQSGTALEIGTSGDTVTVPTGAGLTVTDEVKTNKVSPATGTAFALGDSGDTFTIPSGATITNSGTATGIWYNDDVIQSNIALLGFKVAVNGSLAKYNLVDQAIDEYQDASGVDASASTNEVRNASDYYSGVATTTPSVTEDADSSGVDGDYTWYKWTDTAATGSYQNNTVQSVEWLVLAGGGGGGEGYYGGGGGAGGYRTGTHSDISADTTLTLTVGAGGAGSTTQEADAVNGGDSILASDGSETTVTSTGGGGGASRLSDPGATGGSGGGAALNTGSAGSATSITPVTGETTTVQGFAGGAGSRFGGGGGGAGEVGGVGHVSLHGGPGGNGVQNDIAGSTIYYAGGGGGGSNGEPDNAGGEGGGGNGGQNGGSGTAGTDGLGGGGGGGGGDGADGVDGGNGIVVLRRLTSATGATNMTLQSVDTSAETEADNTDMVMLIENATGTATLNTDVKGYVSRDSGTTFTQGTLVDEGSWGTNKKILAFHDLDISSQPSGTDMCYKIETLNQSEGVKNTRIYATSIGWR
jgi:hypothetical protein